MRETREVEASFSVLDEVPIGMLVLQDDYVVRFWNRCLEGWTGIPRGRVVGTTVGTHFPHLNDEQYTSRLRTIFDGGPPVVFSAQRHRSLIPASAPDGQPRIQHTTVTALPALDGASCYALFTIQDVTEPPHLVHDYPTPGDQALEEGAVRKQAEEQFRMVVESSPTALVMVNQAGEIVLINAQTEALFGYSREELVGQSVEVLIPARFQKSHAAYRTAYFESPDARPMGAGRDLSGRRKDGSEFPVEVGLNPVTMGDEALVLSVITDITERQQASERQQTKDIARKAREYAENIVETVREPLLVLDTDLRVNSANRAFYRTFQVTPEQTEGQVLYDLGNRQWDIPALRELLEAILPENTSFDDFEVAHRFPELGRRTMLLNARQVYHGEEEAAWILLAIEDITARKQAEETVKRYTVELERSNQELEQFAYVASHDLQEPLRKIINFTQLLAQRYDGQLDEKADSFIGYIVDGAERMRTLINDLLTYSRVSTREKAFAPIDLETALDVALDGLSVAVEQSGARVTREPLPTLMADDGQMVQLFQNLIGNAIKFRSEAPPRVHVGAERRQDGWRFRVQDNGIGIDPEYAERIFVIFQRLHGRGEYAGTGIGLAVCKKIVERHDGRIWVESKAGEGATFYFTLAAHEDHQSL